MTGTPRPRRSFAQLAAMSAWIILVWLAFAIFSSSAFQRRMADTAGSRAALTEVLQFQVTSALLWAVFTPFLLALAERFPLQHRRRLRNAAVLAVLVPLMAVLRAAIGGIVHQIGEGAPATLDFILLSIDLRFVRNTMIILVVVGVANLILAQRAAAERERHALALKTALATAELRRLQAGMQPRFLFAMLETIAAEVRRDAERADAMLVQLGQLLRALQDFQNRPRVSLAEELDIVDRSFELERMRTGGRFSSHVDVPEELLTASVPPLLLHALIEGSLPGHDAAATRRVEVTGHARDGQLCLTIRDDHAESPQSAELMRGRLRRLFDEQIMIDWQSHERGAMMELRMPLAAGERSSA